MDEAVKPLSAMAGFPPTPESRIGPHNWSHLPWLRWSLLNRGRQLPNVAVWRGGDPELALSSAFQDLSTLEVSPNDGRPPERLDTLLTSLQADAFVVLHRGRLVWERYWHGMQPEDRHMVASISKCVCGLVAGIVAARHGVDLDRPLAHYLPEVARRPIAGATLQQLMDMTAAIRRAPMPWRDPIIGGQDGGLYEALGLLPSHPDAPEGLAAMVVARPGDPGISHGARFFYDNAQTEAVAWALARATGIDPALLLQDLLWRHVGAERDAFMVVDRLAMPSFSGGIAMTARDMARFGELLRRGGAAANGTQVVPGTFLADLQRGGSADLFASTPYAAWLPGGSYRSFWYVGHDGFGTLLANGRYGQRLWISARSELVVAQFSSISGPPPQPESHALARIWRTLATAFAPT
jgi:CubicO group peptidase (beta-lactamase class C family)